MKLLLSVLALALLSVSADYDSKVAKMQREHDADVAKMHKESKEGRVKMQREHDADVAKMDKEFREAKDKMDKESKESREKMDKESKEAKDEMDNILLIIGLVGGALVLLPVSPRFRLMRRCGICFCCGLCCFAKMLKGNRGGHGFNAPGAYSQGGQPAPTPIHTTPKATPNAAHTPAAYPQQD